jgi:hypothetical protein
MKVPNGATGLIHHPSFQAVNSEEETPLLTYSSTNFNQFFLDLRDKIRIRGASDTDLSDGMSVE